MKSTLFFFLSIFFLFQSSQEEGESLAELIGYCLPSPDGFNFTAHGITQDCRHIPVYPDILNATQRDFKCCEVSMKKKSGDGYDPIKGCIAIMSSYIDDDRYEDIIDYFERGKQYKLQNYFVMLGLRNYMLFNNTYLPKVNGTKYEVEKFDCFSEYKWINIVLILIILFLIY